jgi:hypothetical protein
MVVPSFPEAAYIFKKINICIMKLPLYKFNFIVSYYIQTIFYRLSLSVYKYIPKTYTRIKGKVAPKLN